MATICSRGVRLIARPGTKRSRAAERFARWATLSYRCAAVIAIGAVVVSGAFAVVSPEHLAQRLLTFAFVGVFLGLSTYFIGCLSYWALTIASVIYDPVAAVLEPLIRPVAALCWRVAERAAAVLWACGCAARPAFAAARRHFDRACADAARTLTAAAHVLFQAMPSRSAAWHIPILRSVIFFATLPVRTVAQIVSRFIPSTI